MGSDSPQEIDFVGLQGDDGATLSSPHGLRTLLGGVGHDMGNALVPLVGLAGQLGKGDVPERELRKKVDALLEASLRLFTLSQKLTCFALREGRERIAVDLKGLLRDANRVAGSFFLDGKRLEIDTPEEPVMVRANPCGLLELVLLLLRGAAGSRKTSAWHDEKRSRPGRIPPHVIVRLVVRRGPSPTDREAAILVRSGDGKTPLPALGRAAEAARVQGARLEEGGQWYVVRLPLIPPPLGIPAETEERPPLGGPKRSRKERDLHGE